MHTVDLFQNLLGLIMWVLTKPLLHRVCNPLHRGLLVAKMGDPIACVRVIDRSDCESGHTRELCSMDTPWAPFTRTPGSETGLVGLHRLYLEMASNGCISQSPPAALHIGELLANGQLMLRANNELPRLKDGSSCQRSLQHITAERESEVPAPIDGQLLQPLVIVETTMVCNKGHFMVIRQSQLMVLCGKVSRIRVMVLSQNKITAVDMAMILIMGMMVAKKQPTVMVMPKAEIMGVPMAELVVGAMPKTKTIAVPHAQPVALAENQSMAMAQGQIWIVSKNQVMVGHEDGITSQILETNQSINGIQIRIH